MGIINVLDAQTANMIAAGEVVDRPASALKELLENALDAEATRISVEIKGGGRSFLRITDNGKGFYRDDMPKALLRHATSKIREGSDLGGVLTFGFRGEALAAIGSVSRMEIISKHASEEVGTRLTADENGVVMVDTGCPDGTTVIVKDLFYNTPARQKFLKKDVTEGSACVSVCERAAISHPEVSFSVSIEGERKFYTQGDGKLLSALHSIYGKAFSVGLSPVDYTLEGVSVHGYVCKPDGARGSRAMQMFYVNSRPIRSKTMMAALEEAFRSYLPHGKYPAAVLFLELACTLTDVNVHPAKLEIRFADERKIFSAVYYAVKSTLSGEENAEAPAENEQPKPENTAEVSAASPAAQPVIPYEKAPVKPENSVPAAFQTEIRKPAPQKPAARQFKADLEEENLYFDLRTRGEFRQPESVEDLPVKEAPPAIPAKKQGLDKVVPEDLGQAVFEEAPYYKYIGEAYDAFLFVETRAEVLMIDKHAAHERILYEQLAAKKEVHSQELLSGIPVDLTSEECALLIENAEHLETYGFRVEPFGNGTLLVRAVPATLAGTKDLQSILEGFASDLASGGNLPFAQKCDRALFTVACKAAVKAGIPNDKAHNEWIVRQLMENEKLRYCPHGRPVMHALARRDLEKFFDR